MRILEKYIIGRLLRNFFFLAINFFLLYLIISLLSDLQDILKANVDIKSLLAGYMFNLVTISGRMLTFAFLIASLHLIGTLNYHNEITAMRTEGIGILYLSRMFITIAILISLFCLLVDNNIVPLLRKNRNLAYQSKLKPRLSQKIIENFAYYSQDGHFIFAKKFDVRKNRMEEVNIFKENEQGKLEEEIIASELVWRKHKWYLERSIHYRLSGNDFIFQSPSEEEEIFSLSESPSKLATQTSQSWQYLSLQELRRSIKSFSRWKSSKIANILKLEFHKKIAFSFSSFFLLLAALPFALQIKTRRAGLSSLGTAIIFYFLYYVLSSLSLALGKTDFFLPFIAAWLTNIFFGVSGLVGLMSLQ